MDVGFARYSGKGQGELSILRRLWDQFTPGSVLLADRLMCSWYEMYSLKQKGVDSVTRLNKRRADFRKGKRLGKYDHIVRWSRPYLRMLDWRTQQLLPDYLEVRETQVLVKQAGFRTRKVIVVTTILDADQATQEDLAELYRSRWNNELDFRSIKITMQMNRLRCKTPELVRKEIWTHLLAYNLIRTIMAQAARQHDRQPRSISFKGTLQTVEAFQVIVAIQGARNSAARMALFKHILQMVVAHQVADRPNRFEPRLRKLRPKPYNFMREPRNVHKQQMIKRLMKI